MRSRRHTLRALALTLALTALAPGLARGAQTVALSTSFHPDRLGASTTIAFGFTITALNGAVPSPLMSVDLHLPAGMNISSSTLGLETCEPQNLIADGLEGCSPNARVGYGTSTVLVPFEIGPVQETANIYTLLGPQEGQNITVLFYADGRYPIFAQLVFPGTVLEDSPPFGGRLDTTLPLIPSVPEGPDVSITHLSSTIGPAGLTYYHRRHGHTVAFHPRGILVPPICPRGGFPFAADFTFQDGTHPQIKSHVPCPRPARPHA